MKILDIFFPRTCIVCLNAVSSGAYICKECEKSVKPADNKSYVNKPRGYLNPEHTYASPFIYKDGIRTAVINLKTGKHPFVADAFAHYMNITMREFFDLNQIDIIIPVPMYYIKENQRGYNQAAVLARHLRRLTKIPMKKNIIVKYKPTPEQHTLTMHERVNNLKDTMRINKNTVKGKNILLVDDVLTTGNTFEACASLLKKAGANKIMCISAAIV